MRHRYVADLRFRGSEWTFERFEGSKGELGVFEEIESLGNLVGIVRKSLGIEGNGCC